MKRFRCNLRTTRPGDTRGAPAPELDKQIAGFYTKFCYAALFACIVGAGVVVVTHSVLALILTGLVIFLVLAPVTLLSERDAEYLKRSPVDSVAYWTIFARAHKTKDLPASALVCEMALRTGVLSWLEKRTTPAQREVAFALAPEFDGTIGELLAVARRLQTRLETDARAAS